MQSNHPIGWKGIEAHPESPAGGGGPGRSHSAKPHGFGASVPNAGHGERALKAIDFRKTHAEDIYIEILDTTEKSVDLGDHALKGIKIISAAEAFRKYDWLKDIPITNISGNLRGMVISAQAHSVYRWTSKASKAAGDIVLLLSLALEAYKAIPEAKDIANSTDDPLTKSARISAMVAGICTRTLWTFGTGIVDSSLWLLKNTKYANPGYWIDCLMGQGDAFNQSIDFLRDNIKQATSNVEQFTSNGKLYYFINIETQSVPSK